MGWDGVDGFKIMCDVGCWMIGQDEVISFVYGMFKVVFDVGVVEIQLLEDKILLVIFWIVFESGGVLCI